MTPRKDTSRIILHHTSFERDVSAKEIERWHIKRGFSMIGYHFLVHYDGSVEKGRDVRVVGAHAKSGGRNNDSIGICCSGEDDFTLEQYASVARLIKSLEMAYSKHLLLERHHDKCPGKGFDMEVLEKLL